MGRLSEEFLDRVERFADRVLSVAEALPNQRRFHRVVDQIIGCGTSVGANVFEADEALSRKDFCKCLGISLKELSEAKFWLRLVVRRRWVASARLAALQNEATELKKIMGAILTKSRRPRATAT